MTIDQATVGTRVRSLVDFACVPKGSTGTIDEDYGSGVMVRWDHQRRLRDGFNKVDELKYLEVSENPPIEHAPDELWKKYTERNK